MGRRRRAIVVVEMLEARKLLTGTLTELNNVPIGSDTDAPDPTGQLLLMSNGTVLLQAGPNPGRNYVWYSLAPDSLSYINGTFTQLASSNFGRFGFASDVLPNGTVFVEGGEFSFDPTDPSNPSPPRNKTEIYNPQLNTWTLQDDFTSAALGWDPATGGDDPSEVLSPDGKVLVGDASPNTTQAQIFDPSAAASTQWSTSSELIAAESATEQTWVKLGDGSILTCALDPSTHAQTFERFVPGTGWQTDSQGSSPAIDLWNTSSVEIGPAELLPNGTVFFIGDTGHTMIYTPPSSVSGASWVAGPDVLDSSDELMGSDDTTAAMEANGKVLFVASNDEGGPAQLFEYNPYYNPSLGEAPIVPVSTPSGFTVDDSDNPIKQQNVRMLDLPNGQVLISNGSSHLWAYTPDTNEVLVENPSIGASWEPTITSITSNGGGSFTLTGTQLNGMSEGASFGDDAQMASNYPIISLSDSLDNFLEYVRTSNWNNVWVQTGSTPVTTNFNVSPGNGTYLLSVSASGIISQNALFIEMGGTTDHFTLKVDGSDSSKVDVVDGTGAVTPVSKSLFTKIMVAGDSSSAVFTVDLVNGDPIPAGGLHFSGGGGVMKVEMHDNEVSSIAAGSFSIGGNPVVYGNVSSLVFDVIDGTFTPGGDVGPSGSPPVTINVGTTTTTAAVTFPAGSNQDLSLLNVAGGSTATMSLNTSGPDLVTLTLASLTIASTGVLDLENNQMLLEYGSASDPIGTVQGYLDSGYNGDLWTGYGIATGAGAANAGHHTGIGYADSRDGLGFNGTANSILLMYTLYGDATLDGQVSGADFGELSAYFGAITGATWDEGDFNYNGSITLADFGELASNYGDSIS